MLMLMMIYPQLLVIRAHLRRPAFFSADRDPGLELPAHTEVTLPWCPGCLEDGSGGLEEGTTLAVHC